jgi:P27 family predicted phage terminase small subunit
MGRPKKKLAEPNANTKRPEWPSHLDRIGRLEFDRVVALLEDAGTLQWAFGDVIALYASTYSAWVKASRKITEDGAYYESRGNQLVTPWKTDHDNCVKKLQSLQQQLGLTPASRSKVTYTPKTTVNRLSAFLTKEPDA